MKGEGQWASSSAPAAAPTAKAQPEPMGATRWSGTGTIGIFDKLEVKPYGVLGLQFQGRGDDGETGKETTARAIDLYAVRGRSPEEIQSYVNILIEFPTATFLC